MNLSFEIAAQMVTWLVGILGATWHISSKLQRLATVLDAHIKEEDKLIENQTKELVYLRERIDTIALEQSRVAREMAESRL